MLTFSSKKITKLFQNHLFVAHMKHSHVRQRLVFLEQLAHMTHGHVLLVFLKLVILELIRYYRTCITTVLSIHCLYFIVRYFVCTHDIHCMY